MARISGIGTYIREVVPRVFSGADGWSCALIGPPEVTEPLAAGLPSATTHPCAAPIYSLAEQLELPRAIPRDADLFWAPHYNIPLMYRGRLLVTVHDAVHLAHPEFVKGAHRRWFARMVFDAVRKRAAAVICVSRFTAGELVRLAGFDPANIEVVHQGVSPAWFESPGPSPLPHPYFVYVGNVKPHKNLRGLIRAFSALVGEIPHDLVIVGRKDGFITGDSIAVRMAERLGPRCHFTGEVDDAEVRRYVGNAEALVIPSFYEGFGLPAVEAMAAGCPIVASRVASLPEVCGGAAIYFDPAHEDEMARQMRRIATDPGLRQELISVGRERVRAFDWGVCARETREVLAKVLAR